MSKPAARAFIDKGAHIGPITSGSKNVMIGGKPAARIGDKLNCSQHGEAAIVEGSKTVLINGRAAARLGDKTSCGTPPAKEPEGAKDKMTVLTAAKDTNPDGTVKTQYPKNITAQAMYIQYGLKDKTKDGHYDQAHFGFGVLDFKAKGEKELFGKGNGGIGGSASMGVMKGDAMAGAYGSNGLYGVETTGKAAAISGEAEGYIGGEKMKYVSGKASGELFSAEHEATAVAYTGGSDHKYGFNLQSTEKAAVIKGSAKLSSDMANGATEIAEKKTKLELGGSADAGSVGWDLGLGGWVDTDDYAANIKAKLGAHLVFGAKVDIDVTVNFKPFADLYHHFFPAVHPGTILTGCATVLIG
ncbi:PAAR domain-containing protein [Mucilaginibacter sp.]